MKAFLIYDEDDKTYVKKETEGYGEIACFDSIDKVYDFIRKYMSNFTFIKQMTPRRLKFYSPDDEKYVIIRVEEINIC